MRPWADIGPGIVEEPEPLLKSSAAPPRYTGSVGRIQAWILKTETMVVLAPGQLLTYNVLVQHLVPDGEVARQGMTVRPQSKASCHKDRW